ncbi:MAG: HD domain-containing protein [Oscillospiraceae bacterium]|nr:HD domain-containing protein [Oscillospiraceae bacterium]
MSVREKIIIVDDIDVDLTLAESALCDCYEIYTASCADEFFSLIRKVNPVLILLDIKIPDMDGFEVITKLKAQTETSNIPVIFLTGIYDSDSEVKGLNLGAVDYITKPYSRELLLKRVDLHVRFEKQKHELLTHNLSLESEVDKKVRAVMDLQSAILSSMAELVERRDPGTGGHIERTRHDLSTLIQMLLRRGVYTEELSKIDIPLLVISSQLHDVGKIAIRDDILLKKGVLSVREFVEMKNHTTYGVDIIKRIEKNTPDNMFLQYAEICAGTHHERWDGKGYPNGLKGEEIPLIGRLMSIVDVYDALIHERPYKPAFSHSVAIDTIKKSRETHFDPLICDVFVESADEFKKIDELYRYNALNSDYLNPLMATISNAIGKRGGGEEHQANKIQSYFEILFDALSEQTTSESQCKAWDKEILLASVHLNDVGELSVPDNILNKQGALTEDEFAGIRKHPQFGVQFVQSMKDNAETDLVLHHAERFTGSHHEKWDGTGYPLGLKGKGIPLEGRLIAIADVYDALRTDRPYRKGITHRDAVNLIRNGSGSHFDPELVELFLKHEKEFEQVSLD